MDGRLRIGDAIETLLSTEHSVLSTFSSPLLFADTSQYILFTAGLCVLIWMMLRRSQGRPGRSRAENEPLVRTPRPEKTAGVGLIDAPADVARWEVAMHEAARDMKAELDTKMIALQTLTRLAQTESERLEAAITRARQLGLGAPRDVLDRIDNFVPEEPTAASPPALPSALREQIYTLANQGHPTAAIAAETGAPLGEVELALSLRSHAGS